MRKIIIAANWKKYLNEEESVSLVSQLNDLFNLKNYNHQVMLFPDANHLPSILKEIKKKKINNLFISASENVAWLLNIRGYDNPNSPIPNCKLILQNTGKIYLIADEKKSKKIKILF